MTLRHQFDRVLHALCIFCLFWGALYPGLALASESTTSPGNPPGVSGLQRSSSTTVEGSLERVRIGTFNIRMFPCDTNCACRKPYGYCRGKPKGRPTTDMFRLAEVIKKADPHILALNEILDPERFARFAASQLGPQWKFAFAAEGGPLKVGFLYDSTVITIQYQEVYLGMFNELNAAEHPPKCAGSLSRQRPASACRFRVKGTPFDFYAVVVHLKSRECDSVRKAQWKIMGNIADKLSKTDDEIVILGDFNNHDEEKPDFEEFLVEKSFTLVTDTVPCTHLFRGKGRRLDHIIVSRKALKAFVKGSVRVGGACAESCAKDDIWNAYLTRVSDHCPVVAEFRTGIRGNQPKNP